MAKKIKARKVTKKKVKRTIKKAIKKTKDFKGEITIGKYTLTKH